MLRLLHTADWHLGHALHARSREYEHARFLEWLLATLEAERVDALLICGDIFETIHPPAAAQAALFRFLADARRVCVGLDIVVVGGNHDSAARLEATAPLLEALGVRVVGAITRDDNGAVETARLCVPLRDASGEIAAVCAAVPFLRMVDLRPRPDHAEHGRDPLVEAVREVYAEVFAAAREQVAAANTARPALVATGHGYLVGGDLSALSERRVLGGNQHALPVDVFADDLAYVALGHLHKAQRVGGRDNVRYCGSPIPLSMAEANYAHQVLLVEIDGDLCQDVRTIRVPRAVEFLRVPSRGAGSLEEVLETLAALPARDDAVADDLRAFLEVRVHIEGPEPDLRQRVEAVLEDRAPRLVKIEVERAGDGLRLAEQIPPELELRDLEPETVFRHAFAAEHVVEPDLAILDEFRSLVEAVQTGEESR